MSTAVDADTVFEDYWRNCDICGRPRTRAQIAVRDNTAICYIHPGFRTARELDKINAHRRVPQFRTVKGERPFVSLPTYAAEEDQIFDLVTTVAPFDIFDTTSDGAPGVTGVRSYLSAGWAILYLLAVYNEGKRPLAWRTRALAKARELGDFLISCQAGNGISPGLTSSDFSQGALARSQIDPAFGGVFFAFAADQGLALIAFCRLFVATGAQKYRFAARISANFIVNMIGLSNLCSFGTVAPRFYGPPVWLFNDTSGADPTFFPGDLTCLWGMSELLAMDGDGLYGSPVAGAFFSAAPQRLLSTAIEGMRAFWEEGTSDGGGAVITGLSSTTPRTLFDGSVGTWLGGALNVPDWATGVRALFESRGLTDQVSSCWQFLSNMTANPSFATPAGASTKRILQGRTGAYDSAIAPSPVVSATGQVGESSYAYDVAGLLAPITATLSSARLANVKEVIGTPRPRTFEGSPRDSRTQYLGRLGRSGLSFQPWTATNQRQESVIRAAQVGFLYRYGQAFGGND